MKKTLVLLVSLAFVAGLASAAPSVYGSNGLIMTIKPTNCGPMSFGLGVHGLLSMQSEDGTGYSSSWRNIDVVPEGYIAFNDMLELSVAPGYRLYHTAYTPTGGTETAEDHNGALDTRIGFKGSFIRGDGFNLGAYLGYTYRSGKKFSNYYSWVNDAWEKDSAYSATGAITFLAIPGFKSGKFAGHLNVGVDYDLDKYSDESMNPNMVVPFGLGLCYDVGMVDLMLEVVGQAYTNDSDVYYKTDGSEYSPNLMNYPLWVAPGLRFKFGGGFNFDLGFAYNLESDDSTMLGPGGARAVDWFATAGLAYSKCNLGPKVPATGSIAGKVTDKAGKGLAAMVTAAGLTANTDPATGAYTISGIQIGATPVEIKADAKGYIAKSSSVMLTKKNKKTPAPQDFVLELKPIPASDVSGIVTNYKDGKPVAGANLTFKGPKTVTATTDAAGKYMAKLEEGNYQVAVNSAGFKTKTFEIVAKGGKPVAQNFGLVKEKETFAFADIYFPSGKSDVTAKAEVKLNDLLKVLSENPELKVEIGGHTDGLGSRTVNLRLSQARAEAVVAWLVAKGIKADRLVAKGYGEDKPIASNKTRDGRAQNRRIEINVID